MQSNSVLRGILIALLFIFLVVVALGIGIVLFVRQSTQQALAPINQANEQIRTQVSAILHPTPTFLPDPVTIVKEVRSLARLETIQYTVEKVLTAESGQGPFGFLFGDRLILVAHGTVIAGFDLGKVAAEDVWFEGETVHMRLPQPEVFVATLDNDQTYIYDRERGLLTKGEVNLEAQARQAAEDEILKAALEDNILDQARQNGENFLSSFLRGLGHPTVEFEYQAKQVTPTP